MSSVRIRPGEITDLPAIVAMRDELNALELQACTHAPIVRLGVEQFAAIWGHTFSSPTHCWRIVEADGKPVGFALIYLMPTVPGLVPGAYVNWAYVDARHRRKGVGQMLFDDLSQWATGKGANRIELQFIDGNAFAQKFWTKMGFRPYAWKCVRPLKEPRTK